jgi:TolA-binding protein
MIMKKIGIAALILAGMSVLSQPALAADKVSASAKADSKAEHPLTFWEKLRKKINMFTPQKKLEATTAVGGVRGAQTEVSDVYWKGEANQLINGDELAAFKKAADLAETGDTKQAQAAFADFVKTHPDSPLRKDADQALAMLQKQ